VPYIAEGAVAPEDLTNLLLAASTGDHAAFRRLYGATHQRLFAMLMLLIRRQDVAEDVLQDGYLRVWLHARSFDPARGRAFPWMARIFRNAAFDRMRRNYDGLADVTDLAVTLEAPSIELDNAIDLARALERLTEDQRTAISMMYLYGFTSQQIAERLDTPIGTVKSWVRRGAGRLQGYFQGETATQQVPSSDPPSPPRANYLGKLRKRQSEKIIRSILDVVATETSSETPEALFDTIRRLFSAVHAREAIVRALPSPTGGRERLRPTSDLRLQDMLRFLQTCLPGLDDARRLILATGIVAVSSVQLWMFVRDNCSMDGARAGEAAAQTVAAILEEVDFEEGKTADS